MTCLFNVEDLPMRVWMANECTSSTAGQFECADVCAGNVKHEICSHPKRVTCDDQGTNDHRHNVNRSSNIRSAKSAKVDYEELFDALDLDSCGYITAAKLCHVMTSLGMTGADCVVDEMISMYDSDGNGRLTFSEFVDLMNELGYSPICTRGKQFCDISNGFSDGKRCVKSCGSDDSASKTGLLVSEENDEADEADRVIHISDMPQAVQDVLKLFDFNSEARVSFSDLKQAAKLLEAERNPTRNPEDNPFLHWSKGREKRGLGSLVYKANHIALTVSDVGRSAAFYADVLGLQRIRRPNFDRHGAWFTMGNLELHLIKGTPTVPSGDDLIVGHISIETLEIEKVPEILRRMQIPFQQNVSVPKAADAGQGTNESNTSDKIVKQYFIRDPDGYYIEICNCDVLTAYCLGPGENDLAGKRLSPESNAQVVKLVGKWADFGNVRRCQRAQMIRSARNTENSTESLARILECKKADEVDSEKLKNLLVRRTVYGDICQNETSEDLVDILLHCGNDIPRASELMKLKAAAHGTRLLQPPAFYENGTVKIIPPSFERVAEL